MSQLRRTTRDLHGEHEKPRFRPGLTEARHEIVEGILSPEERLFLVSPGVAGRRPMRRCLAQQHQCIALTKNVEGIEPGEMLPLALKNRDEDTMSPQI